MAELKVKTHDKDSRIVASAGNGDTVVEVLKGPDGTTLQTKSALWTIRSAGKNTAAVTDAQDVTVAVIHAGRLGHTEVELPSGENIVCPDNTFSMGHSLRFGDLASAKAPFLFPQRYFTIKLTDELLAREDRELLIGLVTYLAESAISTSIAVAAT